MTLQSIADGMISTSPEGLVTFINAAAEQMTGWRLSDAINRPLEAILIVRQEEGPKVRVKRSVTALSGPRQSVWTTTQLW